MNGPCMAHGHGSLKYAVTPGALIRFGKLRIYNKFLEIRNFLDANMFQVGFFLASSYPAIKFSDLIQSYLPNQNGKTEFPGAL